MKKAISLILSLLILTAICAVNASALEAEGFTYTEDNGKAVITGYTGSDTNLVIPATLNGLKVEEIEDNAFYQNHNITSVTIENGIEEIGDKAFYNCTGLTQVTIPDSVTDIGDSAFSYCVYLTDVTLGKGIDEISNNCFSHDTRLESIVIPEGVTELDDGAFEECTHLKNVSLPTTLSTIGDYAFAYTYSLAEITLPENLETISEGAFYFNSALTSVTFPESMRYLSHYAFYANSALTTVELNEGLYTMGDMAFDGTAIQSLYIPSTIVTMGSHPFGFIYNEETFEYELNPGFMALCVEGSFGAQICQAHGIACTFVPVKTNTPETTAKPIETTANNSSATSPYNKGDVNFDTHVDEIDTDDIQHHLAYLKMLSEKAEALADYDSNGKVNIKDNVQIQKAMAK